MTMAEKLLDAATDIIALHTELTRAQSRQICESCTYAVLRNHGYQRLPLPSDPLEERYQIMMDIAAMLRDDLLRRNVSRDKAERVAGELLELYRHVRPLSGSAGEPSAKPGTNS